MTELVDSSVDWTVVESWLAARGVGYGEVTEIEKIGGGTQNLMFGFRCGAVASIRPNATILPYAAAKAGLNSLTEGLAQTFAPKVRVNAIMCGTFSTDISKAWSPEFIDAIGAQTALGRVGEPNEIIGAAVYFASDASSYMTGSVLRIDGGMR